MKKIIILSLIACASLSAAAQQAVRIGNMEIIIRKQEQDTTFQINVLDETVVSTQSQDSPRPAPAKPKFNRHSRSTVWGGFGFMLPDDTRDYYTILGGNSFNLDFGGMNRFYLARWFALGWTYNYSFYNYRLRDAYEEPVFRSEVLGGDVFAREDVKRHAFRSHNAAAGVFLRQYLIAPKHRNSTKDRLYIDLGVQGDLAVIKNYVVKFENGGKNKYNSDYAFNPFTASAVARVGWNKHAFFARYRLTESFNRKELPMDLPPINIGIIWLN